MPGHLVEEAVDRDRKLVELVVRAPRRQTVTKFRRLEAAGRLENPGNRLGRAECQPVTGQRRQEGEADADRKEEPGHFVDILLDDLVGHADPHVELFPLAGVDESPRAAVLSKSLHRLHQRFVDRHVYDLLRAVRAGPERLGTVEELEEPGAIAMARCLAPQLRLKQIAAGDGIGGIRPEIIERHRHLADFPEERLLGFAEQRLADPEAHGQEEDEHGQENGRRIEEREPNAERSPGDEPEERQVIQWPGHSLVRGWSG